MPFAVVFPGQGSQSIGMLAKVAAAESIVLETFAEASEVLGYDLWKLSQEGPEEAMAQTERTQPLMLTAGVATWRVWRAGLAAALGIGAGCFVHILAGAVGLSALLAASATAFTVLKIVGAIYLCYVGVSMVLSSRAAAPAVDRELAPAKLSAVFMQGFLTNTLNPKVALFFLAFVPQFISVDAPQKWLAFLFLGSVFNLTGSVWNILVAWLAARASSKLRRSAIVAWLNRGIGAFFVFLGIRLAFAKAG